MDTISRLSRISGACALAFAFTLTAQGQSTNDFCPQPTTSSYNIFRKHPDYDNSAISTLAARTGARTTYDQNLRPGWPVGPIDLRAASFPFFVHYSGTRQYQNADTFPDQKFTLRVGFRGYFKLNKETAGWGGSKVIEMKEGEPAVFWRDARYHKAQDYYSGWHLEVSNVLLTKAQVDEAVTRTLAETNVLLKALVTSNNKVDYSNAVNRGISYGLTRLEAERQAAHLLERVCSFTRGTDIADFPLLEEEGISSVVDIFASSLESSGDRVGMFSVKNISQRVSFNPTTCRLDLLP